MSINHLKKIEQLQSDLEKRALRRQKKKKPKMLVSGKSVLGLSRIIKKKAPFR